jgi:transposase
VKTTSKNIREMKAMRSEGYTYKAIAQRLDFSLAWVHYLLTKSSPKLPEQRFWEKVNRIGDGECWEWLGYVGTDGYGQFNFRGKIERAHRVSYILTINKIEDGKYILHTCDNRKCVNPSHLYQGTAKDNVRDMMNRNKSAPQFRFRKLTKEQVLSIRKEYSTGLTSYPKLARKYDVSISTISDIVNRKIWKRI